MQRPTGVLFDLDGTLVDTVERRIRAWLAAFDAAGIPADRAAVAPLIGSDGRWLARHVAGEAGESLSDERSEEIDRRSGEIYQGLNVDPQPLPGATDLLAALDDVGVPWAIATSSRREQTRASVDALRLAREPVIVDGSHVAHAKPAPDLLLIGAQQLQLAPAGMWCVGDSTFDMRAARAAGMEPIGVTTGSADAATLREAGASEIYGSLVDLIAPVRSWADRSPRSG
jgi:HAD superfamily hydrolase (TIGR01509 family)